VTTTSSVEQVSTMAGTLSSPVVGISAITRNSWETSVVSTTATTDSGVTMGSGTGGSSCFSCLHSGAASALSSLSEKKGIIEL